VHSSENLPASQRDDALDFSHKNAFHLNSRYQKQSPSPLKPASMLFFKIVTSALIGLAVGAVKVASGGVGGEPVVAEVTEAKTGLRGAGGGGTELDSDQQLDTWRYETVGMKASVTRTVQFALFAGTASEWFSSTTLRDQYRTTRKMLYEEFKSANADMSAEVEASMKAGASFPISFVSFSAEVEASFTRVVATGLENSSTRSDEYDQETVSSYETITGKTFSARPAGEPDMVVYREEYKIGNSVFQRVYLACNIAESEREGWVYEVEDVDVSVGVALTGDVDVVVGVGYPW